MKQLELTQELITLIKSRVGEDVNLEGIAVFEAITLNTKPLPGKKGTIFEGAVATPLTLRQISDHINNGGHVPLAFDHNLSDEPKGRVFFAELNYSESGEFELRTLFYVDSTETKLISKINSGSLDEVSISFLATQLVCSECDFDYLGDDADLQNLLTRTCDNGHTIGDDGVHLRMIGLTSLIEVSLVARGAADNPKIVGRSASKLAPAPAQRLAARGFEIEGLVCQASRGEDRVNTDKLVADLVDAQTKVGVLENAATSHSTALEAANTRATELETQLTTAEEAKVELETQLTAAKDESKADEADAAVAYLTKVLEKLHVAAGESAENLPETVAELTAAIDEKTKGLTALIPAGGASNAATETDKTHKASLSAFRTNRR